MGKQASQREAAVAIDNSAAVTLKSATVDNPRQNVAQEGKSVSGGTGGYSSSAQRVIGPDERGAAGAALEDAKTALISSSANSSKSIAQKSKAGSVLRNFRGLMSPSMTRTARRRMAQLALYSGRFFVAVLKAFDVSLGGLDKYAGRIGQGLVFVFRFVGESVGRLLLACFRWTRVTLTPSGFKSRYRQLLNFVHRKVLDRGIEKHMYVSSVESAKSSASQNYSGERVRSTAYTPSPERVFRWAMKPLPSDLSRFTFVDFGAGRGRVLMLASRRNFSKVRGVEESSDLYEDARLNLSHFPRSLMKCRDVDVTLGEPVAIDIPSGPLVLYFFKPFGRDAFAEVLERVVKSYEEKRRTIYIVTVSFDVHDLVESTYHFEPVDLPLGHFILQRFFSPERMRIYKSHTPFRYSLNGPHGTPSQRYLETGRLTDS